MQEQKYKMNNFNFSLYETAPNSKREEEEIENDISPGFNFSLYEPIPADSSSEKNKPATSWESAKDYGKQAAKETLIGAGGTWGDLAELAGINKNTPGKQARVDREFDVLDRMDDPDYQPSFSDIDSLSDDDIVPSYGRLPTSKDLEGVNDFVGGPGEPETMAGRYGKRQGRLYGSGLAFGQVNPVPALAAGGVGQTIEEAEGGPLLQAAGEIATLLLTQGRGAGKTLVGSNKKEVADKINNLRALGYTEQDITLAINSASKGKKMGVKASKGSKTEQAFENFAEHSDEMVNSILENGIQGYEKGAKHVHQMASEAYGQVVKDASKITIKKLDPFFDSMDATMKEIKRSVGHNPEAKNFITELTEHTLDIISNPTAENMIDFYRRLNGLGRWVTRNQKDRIITNVKESIKDTFRAESKQGKELADNFEKVNQGIKKAYQAEDVMEIVSKASTQDGIDFNKLSKAFDKKDNVQLFKEVLGTRQAENLQFIAKTGREVKDFDKAYKATSLFTGTPTAMAGQALYLVYSGSWPALAALKIGEAGSRKLAELSLTDPKFQNLMIRGLHAIKNESPKTFRSVNEAMQKYLNDQGIDINLTI